MFVRDDTQLEVGFAAARAKLADLARGGGLLSVSEAAYCVGTAGLGLLGEPGSVPASRLVKVHFRELITRGDSADLALRWEAAGPSGLFPVLDCDIMLSPAGARATTLTLVGVYRTPPGNLGAGPEQPVVRRAAPETIRAFVDRLADAIAAPAAGRPAGVVSQ